MPMSERRPSTLSSFLPVEMPQNAMAGQQRLQISEFSTPPSFMCWKLRFKTQVSSCSGFPSDAMLWIKEVEMVDSVDELKSSRSVCGNNFPNFKLLDAKAKKEDRFLRGRQIACMIYDYFRVSGAHDTVLDYADLFSITLRNDKVQDFDTRWMKFFDDHDDVEEIGVKPLSYSQTLIHSAYDSAESIATPPDSDLADEQLRKMLASPL